MTGWERGDLREMSFLGRTIRTTQCGVEFEGDTKHVEKLEEECKDLQREVQQLKQERQDQLQYEALQRQLQQLQGQNNNKSQVE